MQILLSTMLRIYDSRKDNFCCPTLLRRLSAEIVDKFSASPSTYFGDARRRNTQSMTGSSHHESLSPPSSPQNLEARISINTTINIIVISIVIVYRISMNTTIIIIIIFYLLKNSTQTRAQAPTGASRRRCRPLQAPRGDGGPRTARQLRVFGV